MNRKSVRLALALTAIAIGHAPAGAEAGLIKFEELLKRLPRDANLIMLVDYDGLFDSPLGRREGWRARAGDPSRNRAEFLPDVARAAAAARMGMNDLDLDWRVGMAEFRGDVPTLADLAASQGGFVEKIGITDVAWTPRDIYFIDFKPGILGFVTPAGRQGMSHWMRDIFAKPKSFPPGFADHAVYRAEAGAAVVLAVDLADAVAPQRLGPWLDAIEAIGAAKIDPKLLSDRLATVKSAFLQVDVRETIEGTLLVEFDREIGYAAPAAKEIVLAALEEAGAVLPDLRAWSSTTKDKSIELKGRLSEDSLVQVLGLALPPRLTTPAAPAPTENGAASRAVTRDDAVKASQGYFRAVVDATEGIKGQKAESHRGMRLWYERAAKRIEELPLLGVDSDLLDWGSEVARTLREMAHGIDYAGRDQSYRISSTSGGYYGGYGSRSADADAITRQSNAVLGTQLDGTWQGLETSIAETRRAMVRKYQVDF